MSFDPPSNPLPTPDGNPPNWPRPVPRGVRLTWLISFLALVVGIAAAASTALWLALILIPAAIIISGIVSILYRLQLARARRWPAPPL